MIIFFVLSGVVLTLSYERQPRHGLTRLMAYYIKRGARLWPLLATVAIFAFILRDPVGQLHEAGGIYQLGERILQHRSRP